MKELPFGGLNWVESSSFACMEIGEFGIFCMAHYVFYEHKIVEYIIHN